MDIIKKIITQIKQNQIKIGIKLRNLYQYTKNIPLLVMHLMNLNHSSPVINYNNWIHVKDIHFKTRRELSWLWTLSCFLMFLVLLLWLCIIFKCVLLVLPIIYTLFWSALCRLFASYGVCAMFAPSVFIPCGFINKRLVWIILLHELNTV